MRAPSVIRVALLGLQASLSTQLALPSIPYPTTTLANVTVIDTELVREAQAFARQHSNDIVYNHVIRGWLYSSIAIARNETLRRTVDLEAQAIASLLHDLGWDMAPNSSLISPDKRFEVDGAFAARDFIRSRSRNPAAWSDQRLQLVWDSIALHTQQSIFQYKEDTVALTGAGIFMDFTGPAMGVTQQEYDAAITAFPKTQFLQGVKEEYLWLCATKPNTTYDTFLEPFGDAYVANYSSKGHRIFDMTP